MRRRESANARWRKARGVAGRTSYESENESGSDNRSERESALHGKNEMQKKKKKKKGG